ncbi:MAG TPA: hypothetical protein PKH77_00475 [Anaerolineae bacterium]|nr:hypothetical protein [Anaerolineae bacterium]
MPASLLSQAQAAAGQLAFMAQIGHGMRDKRAVTTLHTAQAIAAGHITDATTIEITLDDLGAFALMGAALRQGAAVERAVANADQVRRQLRGVLR